MHDALQVCQCPRMQRVILYILGPTAIWYPMSPHFFTSFQAIGTGSGIQGYRPCWCPSTFPPRLPYLGVFPFTLHLSLDFIRVSYLRPTYLHPSDRSFSAFTC